MTDDLGARRRWYAEDVALRTPDMHPALIEAFATVPRERFLGPPPWTVLRPVSGRPLTPWVTDDPGALLHCVLVVIDPERQLNNGDPSALASWIGAVLPRPGERVVHVGCGVGYYTAVIAELVGPTGQVTGIEVDPDLADRARANLADRPNVAVVAGDAAEVPDADVIFVNAGCTGPRPAWLAAVPVGGRIAIPLTDDDGLGLMVRLERTADGWSAAPITTVGIYPCAGARDPADAAVIHTVRTRGGRPPPITRMHLDPHPAGPACAVHAAAYCLSSDDPPPPRFPTHEANDGSD